LALISAGADRDAGILADVAVVLRQLAKAAA
jgi:hypothetical protein